MKYIKLFNEARVEGTRMTQWYQPDQGEELLDFSIDNLAYLMDDGYKVIVETSSDNITIPMTMLLVITSILISLLKDVDYTQ